MLKITPSCNTDQGVQRICEFLKPNEIQKRKETEWGGNRKMHHRPIRIYGNGFEYEHIRSRRKWLAIKRDTETMDLAGLRTGQVVGERSKRSEGGRWLKLECLEVRMQTRVAIKSVKFRLA